MLSSSLVLCNTYRMCTSTAALSALAILRGSGSPRFISKSSTARPTPRNATFPAPGSINPFGFGHIAFAVDDVDACLAKLIEHGGSTVGETVRGTVDGVGAIHLVYAKDPEGNIIEIQTWG